MTCTGRHWPGNGIGALLGPSYHVLNEGTEIGPGEAELWYDRAAVRTRSFSKRSSPGRAVRSSGTRHRSVVPVGHSGGAQWISTMVVLHPGRVIAAWVRSGGVTKFHSRHPEWPDHQVPRLFTPCR